MKQVLNALIFGLTVSAAHMAAAKDHRVNLEPNWEFVVDTVMGGVSTGTLRHEDIAGRPAARLTGQVSLENNGGFVQMAFDLRPGGGALDASDFTGLEIDVYGNGEVYDLRLRTTALTRPWQSFRMGFTAPPAWTTLRIPFADIEPNKTDADFDLADLRRIGILGYGRAFSVDIAVSAIRFYR
ncbi:MAG: CIA30 family protein [Sulfitobacter sp.]